MQIRPIEQKDNAEMERIIKQSLEAVGLDIPGTAYTDPQLGDLYGHYAGIPDAAYWVAVDAEDRVLGGIGIGPFDETQGICELQKLYVAPRAQGRGLSKELMAEALDFARRHYASCYLETSTKLATANRLYGKLGFQELDRPLDGSEHGAMDAWYMKDLES
ncbi:GNAT family N-acetyltransferase [Sporosarcina trichiuri]|uniref:GNAT family N-acetyltransferase n=1 Tax=Sporosarcina trichiuri TaxID=3056445 RepID=UPI0025B391C8|nr:GNAT family N-acetyltransferase [Sporosarcina sp. 0.2-SM1T-5]WJY26317.1 GNAT family N-acetyltransferase [Sporosarcina sp. 0.2-SM1T-5]